MRFDRKKPCNNCPFRSDVEPYLRASRMKGIIEYLEKKDGTFTCHKTTGLYAGKQLSPEKQQHCAGALIYVEKNKTVMQNWVLRYARTRLYKPDELDMDAPIIDGENYTGCDGKGIAF